MSEHKWRVWRAFENRREWNIDRAFSLAIRDACRVNGKVDVDKLDWMLDLYCWSPVAEA